MLRQFSVTFQTEILSTETFEFPIKIIILKSFDIVLYQKWAVALLHYEFDSLLSILQ